MKYNYSKLLGRIRELGLNQEDVAKHIGISASTFNRKLNNYSDFTQPEIDAICELLNISKEKIGEYFFDVKVQKN